MSSTPPRGADYCSMVQARFRWPRHFVIRGCALPAPAVLSNPAVQRRLSGGHVDCEPRTRSGEHAYVETQRNRDHRLAEDLRCLRSEWRWLHRPGRIPRVAQCAGWRRVARRVPAGFRDRRHRGRRLHRVQGIRRVVDELTVWRPRPELNSAAKRLFVLSILGEVGARTRHATRSDALPQSLVRPRLHADTAINKTA